MNMDNSTAGKEEQALARAIYCGLLGTEIDQRTRSMAAIYANNLFVSPWQDESDAVTKAYGQGFFTTLRDMEKATAMAARWGHGFTANNTPISSTVARDFLTDFFRRYLRQPRDYHHFVCQRRDIQFGGILDFPVEHPIAVEFWAIYITVAGSGTLNTQGQQFQLGPHTIAVVPPGATCTLSRDESAEHWCYHWLSFRSRLEWIELLEWAMELTRPVFFQMEDHQSYSGLIQQTEQLEATTYQPGSLSEKLCNNIIQNILIRIRLLAETEAGDSSHRNTKVQAAVDFILNNYAADIGLERVAREVNISTSRLSTLFREHFGISVIKWRDHIRMQKAKELLLHGNASIGSIASRVGYSDALYFSRRFKEHFDKTPSDFRNT